MTATLQLEGDLVYHLQSLDLVVKTENDIAGQSQCIIQLRNDIHWHFEKRFGKAQQPPDNRPMHVRDRSIITDPTWINATLLDCSMRILAPRPSRRGTSSSAGPPSTEPCAKWPTRVHTCRWRHQRPRTRPLPGRSSKLTALSLQNHALFVINEMDICTMKPKGTGTVNGSETIASRFWRHKEAEFLNIALLARKYLCIPASSAACERLYEQCGLDSD